MKSRRDDLFIDQQPPYPPRVFVFQPRNVSGLKSKNRLEGPVHRSINRSSLRDFCLLLVIVSAGFPSFAASLRDDWTDPDTGHRVTRLSRIPGESESFYFHQNAFTAEGDKMVFANTGTNRSRDFYVLDWATRKAERLTDGGTNRGELVCAKGRRLYYMRDGGVYVVSLEESPKSKVQSPKSETIDKVDDKVSDPPPSDSGAASKVGRMITRLPPGWRGLTVNADETLLVGAFGEGATELSRGQPRSYWFKAIKDAKLPHILFTIEIATGKTNVFHRGNDWFNHMQFSPTDPSLLMFCHEGPWHEVDRIWTIRVPTSSSLAAPKPLSEGGSLAASERSEDGPHLVHRRSIPDEIAGHEFWSPDGSRIWFDLQIPRGEKFFLASAEVGASLGGVRALPPHPGPLSQGEGASSTAPVSKVSSVAAQPPGSPSPWGEGRGEGDRDLQKSSGTVPPTVSELRYPVTRDQWSVHFNISRDGKLFAGDGGAPNMVAHAENGKWLYLFTPQPDGTLKAERLVNMSKHDYALEPNVNFTPDGKWIVFRANFDGSSQVYAVEVAKAKGRT